MFNHFDFLNFIFKLKTENILTVHELKKKF